MKSFKEKLKFLKNFSKWNKWLLQIKIISFLLRKSKNKTFMLNLLSIDNILKSIFDLRLLNTIIEYKKLLKNKENLATFIFKYITQRERNRILGFTLDEINQEEEFLCIKNQDIIEKIHKSPGAIILGLHYGPDCYSLILKHAKIKSKVLVSDLVFDYCDCIGKYGLNWLKTAKYKYVVKNAILIKALKSEKTIVKELKANNNILFLLDLPAPKKGTGILADFLGGYLNFSYFAFKLSLSYNKPVFICYQQKSAENDKFDICFKELNDFATPEEGLKKYLSCVEELIRKEPSMWLFAPLIKRWNKEAEQAENEKKVNEFELAL